MAVPKSDALAQMSPPSQSLSSTLQRFYSESFIPEDLNGCQMLLREILVNHRTLDEVSYSPDHFDDILDGIF